MAGGDPVKELHGSARSPAAATADRCLELLAAVDEYPRWYPDVIRSAEVVQRGPDGRPTQARATVHVAQGPLTKDFNLLLGVDLSEPRRVKLSRIPHDASDRERFEIAWTVTPEETGAQIALELDANLSVPRLLPLGGIGDTLARGFVAAAVRAAGRQS